MATFNGTPGADQIAGTNDDDIITGIAGADEINGAGGNDDIDGGTGADTIVGGDGDDTIDGGIAVDSVNGEAGDDVFAAPDNAGDTIDGGDDDDTLVTDLTDLDALKQSLAMTLNGSTMTGATISNIEYVQVSNAGDFMIDLTSGDDQVFGFDVTLDDSDFDGDDSDLVGATYNGTTDAIADDSVTFDEDEGIVINGTTYADGDTYTTAAGGTVTVGWNVGTVDWNLDYAAPQDLATVTLDSVTEDEVLSVQATDDNGDVISYNVTLNIGIDNSIYLNGGDADFTTDTKIVGSASADTIADGTGNDTIVAGDGADDVTVGDGDNQLWAGAADTGNDDITIDGDGDNVVAGGAGDDEVTIDGDGNNEVWGGAGGDDISIDGDGNNTVGGGAGADDITVQGAGDNQAWGGDDNDDISIEGDGNNMVGGGDGQDTIYVDGDGDNAVYGGADEENDTISVTGDGDNTIYGGGSDGSNTITIAGNGDNIVFNGGGDNDVVNLAATATGSNVVYGGAGDDTFNFVNASVATVVISAGNGNETLNNFNQGGDDFSEAQYLDLSAFGFADADEVLDNVTESGGSSSIFITAGQTITLTGATLAELQAADPADWLIL
mmetsp:Transcript_10047/g.14728  ORF Transcript_10047/g.14728 Transcript_10047/m.14728 type:complete len:608 (-) Transcript_10047:70-1893(-)|eukprot:CAMPEP_0197247096 /NCGR_PEP_ID=MMETSP1429-20130617/26095_1 /TAXON_ID=49237 /ORGANISM="Chaetoceros  sp., Strain UNC1202" /LENGTH=607 /DNA_ID=CAMNT_0042707919 /DNA_START=235 /DNA_END=2058 /DNA_ORIENTATION=+